MNIRTTVRAASFAICFIIALAAFAIKGNTDSTRYKAKLEATYQASLTELAECLDSIETNLTKSAYATTPNMTATLSRDLYSECNTAKNALSQLPIEQMNLSGAYKFLSQASDYANYLSSKISSGEEISDEEYKNMNILLSYAKAYSKSVGEMVNKCAYGNKITDNEIKANNSKNKTSSLSLDFTQAEDTFKDYPTLIYDGPFADAVLNKESSLLKAENEITKEKAMKIAATVLNTSTEKLNTKSDEYGKIPCYVFECGGSYTAITKQGGYVAYILNSNKAESQTVTEENAINLGKAQLEKMGYKNMESTYYTVDNNVCLINYAYTESNTIYYSDLIKVGISLSDGKIYSLEAEGYLTNHCQRQDFKDEISLSDAEAEISDNAEIISAQKAIIPLKNGKEALCYEFHCKNKNNDEEVLIYTNTETGEEENILLLLYSDNGTLTK